MLPEALPYHEKVRDYFRSHTSIWEFFGAAHTRDEQLAAFQTDLLKNTYRFSREGEPGLFEKVDRVRDALALTDLPVMAYQAAGPAGNELNASIIYIHQEAHLVFNGPVLEKLDERELLAVIAHELAHVRLYTLHNGELEIADRIITSIANSEQSDSVYLETARRFKLYTEIYCDRCAYAVMNDPTVVIGMLLKLETGLTTGSLPHPETYIRTRAIHLYHLQGEAAAPAIEGMIEGVSDLDRLDLFFQRKLKDLTSDLIQEYLRPVWIHTEIMDGLQHQYFPDQKTRNGTPTAATQATPTTHLTTATAEGTPTTHLAKATTHLATEIGRMPPDLRTYFGYVLLDFALADPSLEDMPAARALELAAAVHLTDIYDTICKKELQLNDKKWQQQKEKLRKAYAALSND